ncbi:MAG: class I SAM-dependent methyltransferase, partial [Anaerolineae bacterium]
LFWWEAGPELARHINAKITGDPQIDWIAYTLHKYFNGRLPLQRCLSLGCGTGHLERTLARYGAFVQCDAYDVADRSLRIARELAESNGLSSINYYLADVNQIVLPSCVYDAVWIHGAMHHFTQLEHICEQISRAIRPGGYLILNEYVGPNRFQFPIRQKQVANCSLQLLPERYRRIVREAIEMELERSPFKRGLGWSIHRLFDKVRDGDVLAAIRRRITIHFASRATRGPLKSTIVFPTARDVAAADPSEAIRSADIIPVLQRYFKIVEQKGWGGNILQFLLSGIAGNFAADDQTAQLLLRMLLNIEDTLIQCGEFESDFAFIVAQPLDQAQCGV